MISFFLYRVLSSSCPQQIEGVFDKNHGGFDMSSYGCAAVINSLFLSISKSGAPGAAIYLRSDSLSFLMKSTVFDSCYTFNDVTVWGGAVHVWCPSIKIYSVCANGCSSPMSSHFAYLRDSAQADLSEISIHDCSPKHIPNAPNPIDLTLCGGIVQKYNSSFNQNNAYGNGFYVSSVLSLVFKFGIFYCCNSQVNGLLHRNYGTETRLDVSHLLVSNCTAETSSVFFSLAGSVLITQSNVIQSSYLYLGDNRASEPITISQTHFQHQKIQGNVVIQDPQPSPIVIPRQAFSFTFKLCPAYLTMSHNFSHNLDILNQPLLSLVSIIVFGFIEL